HDTAGEGDAVRVGGRLILGRLCLFGSGVGAVVVEEILSRALRPGDLPVLRVKGDGGERRCTYAGHDQMKTRKAFGNRFEPVVGRCVYRQEREPNGVTVAVPTHVG